MRYLINRFWGRNSSNFSVKRRGKKARLTAFLAAVLFSAAPIGVAWATDIYVTGSGSVGPANQIWYQNLNGSTRHNADGSTTSYNLTNYITDGTKIILVDSNNNGARIDNSRAAFSTTFAGGEFSLVNQSIVKQTVSPSSAARMFLITGGTGTTFNFDGTNGELILSGYSNATASGGTIRNDANAALNINGNVTFNGNSSGGTGGVIYSAGALGKVTLGQYAAGSGTNGVMQFIGNSATSGAAIEARGGLLINTDTIFDRNYTPVSAPSGRGTIIDARGVANAIGGKNYSLVVGNGYNFTFNNNSNANSTTGNEGLLSAENGAYFGGDVVFDKNTIVYDATNGSSLIRLRAGDAVFTGSATFSNNVTSRSAENLYNNSILLLSAGNAVLGSDSSDIILFDNNDGMGIRIINGSLTVNGTFTAKNSHNTDAAGNVNGIVRVQAGSAVFNADATFSGNSGAAYYAGTTSGTVYTQVTSTFNGSTVFSGNTGYGARVIGDTIFGSTAANTTTFSENNGYAYRSTIGNTTVNGALTVTNNDNGNTGSIVRIDAGNIGSTGTTFTVTGNTIFDGNTGVSYYAGQQQVVGGVTTYSLVNSKFLGDVTVTGNNLNVIDTTGSYVFRNYGVLTFGKDNSSLLKFDNNNGTVVYSSQGDVTFNGNTSFSNNFNSNGTGAFNVVQDTVTFNGDAYFNGNISYANGEYVRDRNGDETTIRNDDITQRGLTNVSAAVSTRAADYVFNGDTKFIGNKVENFADSEFAIHVDKDTHGNILAKSVDSNGVTQNVYGYGQWCKPDANGHWVKTALTDTTGQWIEVGSQTGYAQVWDQSLNGGLGDFRYSTDTALMSKVLWESDTITYGAAFSSYARPINYTNPFNTVLFEKDVLFKDNETIQKEINNYNNGADAARGGAVFARNAEFRFEGDSYFVDNYTSGRGGAVYLRDDWTTLAETSNLRFKGHTEFIGNQAGLTGGAIYSFGGLVRIEDSALFKDNKSGGRGGAIFMQDDDQTGSTGGTLQLITNNNHIIFTGNRGGIIDPNVSPEFYEVITTLDFANDITTNGTITLFNVINDYKVSFDGGIWMHANDSGGLGAAHGGTVAMLGDGTGRVEFVGDEVWSFVAGGTYVSNTTFHLGKDALWGKRGSDNKIDNPFYNPDEPIDSVYNSLTATQYNTSRDEAIASQFGIGTYFVAPVFGVGINNQERVFTEAATLSYEMGMTSNTNIGGHNAVIYADRIVVADNTHYEAVDTNNIGYTAAMYSIVNGQRVDITASTQTSAIDLINDNGQAQFNMVKTDGTTLSTADDPWWRTGFKYDLLHANHFDATNNTGGLFIEKKLYRGEQMQYGLAEFGPNWFMREGTYDSETRSIFGADPNIYGVELYDRQQIVESPDPYYDPSFLNQRISARLDRLCRPWTLRREEQLLPPSDSMDDSDEIIILGQQEAESYLRNSFFACPDDNRWNVWAEGYGTGGQFNKYKGLNGYKYSNGGLLVGTEREHKSGTRLGFYYSYANSWTRDRYIRNTGDEHTFGLFMRVQNNNGYTLFMGNLGFNTYKRTRQVIGAVDVETFNSNFRAYTSGAYLERGLETKWGTNHRFTPFGALQYGHLKADPFTETTQYALSNDLIQAIKKYRYDSFRSALGFRTQSFVHHNVLWSNGLHWEHEFFSKTGIYRELVLENHQELGTYRNVSNYGGRDWCVGRTGVEFALSDNIGVNFNYEIQFNQHMTLHTGMSGLIYKF